MTYFSSICPFKGVVKVFLLQDDLLFPHLPFQSCNHRLLYSKMNNFSASASPKLQSQAVVFEDDLLFPHLPFQSCNHKLLYSKMNLFFPHLPVQRCCKGVFTPRWPTFPASASPKLQSQAVVFEDEQLFPHLPFQSCNHRLLYSKMNLLFPHPPVQRGCKGGSTPRWPTFPASAIPKLQSQAVVFEDEPIFPASASPKGL